MIGGSGNDTLTGGRGNDVLTGGSGADVFVINSLDGIDRILDYQDGEDKFSLGSLNFSDLDLTQRGRNVVISEDNTILAELVSVNVSVLNRSDFIAT